MEDSLRLTAAAGGRTFEPSALEYCTRAAGGFPYMLQLVGFRTWARNPYAAPITLEDARQGVLRAKEELSAGVLEATYASLSDGDRAFLDAMAAIGETASLPAIAKGLGKSTSYASAYKERLLTQGVIAQTPRGELTFLLPFFHEYLRSLAGE